VWKEPVTIRRDRSVSELSTPRVHSRARGDNQQVVQTAQIRATRRSARRSRPTLGARKNSHVEERLEERAEDAAEVLARLERYVASSRARPPGPVAPPADTLIPSHDVSAIRHRRFVSEVAPALIAVAVCSFVILLSAWFDVNVAAVVGVALLMIGVVGLVRRVPLARAYTFGLLVAALLIRLS
jgi:hypothetical protein